MRRLHRGIVAGLLSAPLVLGLSGVASAADAHSSQARIDDTGVSVQPTHTGQGSQDPGFSGHRYHAVGEHGGNQAGNHAGEDEGGLLNLLF